MADVERKFRGNVGKRWSQEQMTAAFAALWGLEQANNLSALLGELAVKT